MQQFFKLVYYFRFYSNCNARAIYYINSTNLIIGIIENTDVDIKTEPTTNPETTDNDETAAGLLLHLTTKYYKTELLLVPFENDLSLLPKDIVDRTEAVLVYFDAKQVFISTI